MPSYKIDPDAPLPPDIEPFYIRQTGETDHCMAAEDWFKGAAKDAHGEGARFFRYSVEPDESGKKPKALLIEGWTEQPADQGQPRWSWAA